MATLQLGGQSLDISEDQLTPLRQKVAGGYDANKAALEYFQGINSVLSRNDIWDNSGRITDAARSQYGVLSAVGNNPNNFLMQREPTSTGVLALGAVLSNKQQPTQYVPGSLQGTPQVVAGTAPPPTPPPPAPRVLGQTQPSSTPPAPALPTGGGMLTPAQLAAITQQNQSMMKQQGQTTPTGMLTQEQLNAIGAQNQRMLQQQGQTTPYAPYTPPKVSTLPTAPSVSNQTLGISTPSSPLPAPNFSSYGSQGSSQSSPAFPQQSQQGGVPSPYANMPTMPDLSSLENAYRQNLTPTAEETSAEQRLAALFGSRDLGIAGIENEAIAMPLIMGQTAALEKQANIKGQTLQNQLAILQAKRQSALEASKFSLERGDKQAATQRANYESERTFSENVRQFGLQFALEQKEKNEGFTLGEGQNRYDAQGNMIASGAPKSSTSNQPTSVQEYEYAKAQGYKGTYNDYQNLDANRKASIARAGVGSTGLSTQQYGALNSITTKFQADSIVNQAVKGQTAVAIADQIISNPGSATSQLKSLYVLVKNLDPDSAVREGELALASQTQSYLQVFGNTLARINEGRVIAPDAAVAMAQATKELMSAWNQTAQKRQQQYNSQANTLGVGGEFGSYIAGSNLGYNANPSPPQNTAFNKGPMTNSAFVAKAVQNSGQSYQNIISGAPKGQIPVVENNTGQIGYIPAGEFNSGKYTKL